MKDWLQKRIDGIINSEVNDYEKAGALYALAKRIERVKKLHSALDAYQAAVEYFKKVNMPWKAQEAEDKRKEIVNVILSQKGGYEKKYNKNKLL